MTIKQNGGIFGRNPTFNDVSVDGSITSNGIQINNGTVILDVGDEGTLQVGPTTTSADENQKIEMRGANGSNEVQRFQIENSGENGRVDFLFGRADGTPTRVMQIGALKDVLFYKDDGTTNALTFDASSGNLAFASGNGIDFSATSGTGTSELFDDYEEGTWTATLFDANSGGNASSTTATGYYTKIGRIVNCIVSQFTNVDTSGMSGFLRMSLPFTPVSVYPASGFYSTGTASMISGTFPANTYMLTVAVYHGEARAYLQAQGTNGFTSIGTTNITSGTTDLNQMTFSYIAA